VPGRSNLGVAKHGVDQAREQLAKADASSIVCVQAPRGPTDPGGGARPPAIVNVVFALMVDGPPRSPARRARPLGDASGAGVDATNPQQLPSASDGAVSPEQLPWVLPDGALPIGDAPVDARYASDTDAEALSTDADADALDVDAGLLDAGEPFTFLVECSNFLDASLGDVVDAAADRVA